VDKTTTLIGTASIVVALIVCAAPSTLHAQAGSIGGTIGKTDKSVSGGDETQPPSQEPQQRRQGARQKPQLVATGGCGNIAGEWE
jgi:hypothetical protein